MASGGEQPPDHLLRPRNAFVAVHRAVGDQGGVAGAVTENLAVFVLFALVDPATVWVASNAADQVIHGLTAAGGIVTAAITSSERAALRRS